MADLTGIAFAEDAAAVGPDEVEGFFAGWPKHPDGERFQRILRGSYCVVIARDEQSGRLVGFVNAISDGELTAHIPLLEVVPEFQGRGIGSELMRRMLARLAVLPMVDLTCDPELVPYYEGFGMRQVSGMVVRNAAAL